MYNIKKLESMNEKLNLVKILKDCPKGTKFYSSYLGKNVIFIEIYDNHIKCEYSSQIDSLNCSIQFRKDGSLYPGGDCMLFPSKEQRDWSKWHRPFKDGDIVISDKGDIHLLRTSDSSYCAYIESWCGLPKFDSTITTAVKVDRFATKEEKQKLFDAIKANGYKWNAETKTLKELKKEKFDPKTLQPFDKVLARHRNDNTWYADFFSNYNYNEVGGYAVCAGGVHYSYCIPYNEDTKHLAGKSDEAPEFYRYWED